MRLTQEQMQSVINEWQNSSLSKKAFCRQRDIRYSTFHYWHKRLQRPTTTPGFTAIKVESPGSGNFQIIFSSGTRIVFEGEPSVSWLRDLVG